MTIKELRLSYGITQQALSEITGIPKRTIENWEGGQRTPPTYIPYLIECALKINQNDRRMSDDILREAEIEEA